MLRVVLASMLLLAMLAPGVHANCNNPPTWTCAPVPMDPEVLKSQVLPKSAGPYDLYGLAHAGIENVVGNASPPAALPDHPFAIQFLLETAESAGASSHVSYSLMLQPVGEIEAESMWVNGSGGDPLSIFVKGYALPDAVGPQTVEYDLMVASNGINHTIKGSLEILIITQHNNEAPTGLAPFMLLPVAALLRRRP